MTSQTTIRPATRADAQALCDVINPIIATGGTTANEKPFTPETMISAMIEPVLNVCCTLAEADGQVLGFQWLGWADPDWQGPEHLPADWTIIATFVSQLAVGRGVGKALMEATKANARAAGSTTIDATIRADNVSGLGYYSAMGFVDYGVLKQMPLSDGTPVDRIRKRFDLT